MSLDTKPRGFDFVAYLKLFRFPLVFTAIADSAAGYLMGDPWGGFHVGTLVLLAICSAGLYFFGMAMNDIADHKRDRELAPTRPIPSGRISMRSALAASLICLAASFAALLAIPNSPVIYRLGAWGTAVVAILAYDFFLKVPPTMGLVRASNLAIGLLASTLRLPDRELAFIILLTVPTFLYVTGLTFVSTLEDGAIHRVKLWFGAGVMVIAAFMTLNWNTTASFALLQSSDPSLGGVPFDLWDAVVHLGMYFRDAYTPFVAALATAGPLALWTLRRAWKATDRKGVMLMVRDGVGGIILLDASLILYNHRWVPGLCVAALVIPAILSVMVFRKLA